MGSALRPHRPKLLFLITEDWTFWEIRRDLARAARDAGYEVVIATRVTHHAQRILAEGFRLVPVALVRSSRNPFSEIALFLQLVRLYARERPRIVHHVAMKPILYGSLAAWITRIPVVLNAFAGLGYAFTDRPQGGSLLRRAVRIGLRIAVRLSRSVVVFQNADDRALMIREGIVPREQTRLITGSGVDTDRFVPAMPAAGPPIVLLAGRMLWDKGVGEFVEAARLLKQQGWSARFVLVGRRDQENPTAIDEALLARWSREDGIEWWGHREDMPEVLGAATLVVLPSYREGLPKVLLEAASCGKALIATDVPGCRDAVVHGQTGFLVSVRDPSALAEAIARLLSDHERRETFGKAGREFVLREHTKETIARQFLDLYRELCEASRAVSMSHLRSLA